MPVRASPGPSESTRFACRGARVAARKNRERKVGLGRRAHFGSRAAFGGTERARERLLGIVWVVREVVVVGVLVGACRGGMRL